MDIQFSHIHSNHINRTGEPSITVALDAPSKKWLLSILSRKLTDLSRLNIQIELEVGIARCSPKDLYSKDIGRSIAVDKIKTESFKFDSVWRLGEDLYISLINSDKDSPLHSIELKTHEKNEKLHLVNAYQRI